MGKHNPQNRHRRNLLPHVTARRYNHFVDLMTESRIAHETIDNAIKANEQRISAWGYIRKDIADLNRTRKIYNEYRELKKSTKFFTKRTSRYKC